MKLIPFLIASFVFLSACGGGGSSSSTPVEPPVNLPPVANNDNYEVNMNVLTELNVLSNDNDSDSFSITAITAASNGTVDNNQTNIRYTPNEGYIGNDTFTYTITDTAGQASTAEVTLSVINPNIYQLKGKIVGIEQAGLELVLRVGEIETRATTDALGQYNIAVDFSDQNALVIASVAGTVPNYTMYAYFGDVASLVANSTNRLVENRNITDLTTAEYELIELVLKGDEATTQQELTAAQFDADNFHQLRMTIASQLINQDNGLELPDGFSTVNEFIKSTSEMGKQLTLWRENHNEIYHQAYTDLSTGDLARFPDRITTDQNLLTESAAAWGSNFSRGYGLHLNLAINNGKYFARQSGSFDFDWQKIGKHFQVDFNEAVDLFSSFPERLYCSDSHSYFNFNVKSFELTQLYSTVNYDVYLQKMLAVTDANNDCLADETIFYNIVRHHHAQELALDNEPFMLNKPIVNSSIAELTLSDDGSFIDSGDVDNILSGTWQYIDNSLRLDYSDESTFVYNKIGDLGAAPQVSMRLIKEGEVAYVSTSHLTKKSVINWENNAGYFSFELSPIFNPYVNSETRWKLNEDNTGSQQKLTDGVWADVGYRPNTWRLENNTYFIDAYYDTDAGWVNFCDVSLASCYIALSENWEIVGSVDERYIVKFVYKRYNSQGEETYSANSVRLIKFTSH